MSFKPVLYLAGPIAGCTEGQAKDWRADIAARLPMMNCISPLRCEPMPTGQTRYDDTSIVGMRDLCFGDPRAILAKNFLDTQRCDMVLAYFPTPPEIAEAEEALSVVKAAATLLDSYEAAGSATYLRKQHETLTRIIRRSPQRSVGTIGEVSWAYALRKPLVIVSQDPVIVGHPFTNSQPSWPVLPNLKEAVRLISGIFTDYVRG